MAAEEAVGIRFEINGEPWEGTVPPTEVLLDFLRGALGLIGTKRGCEWMSCGVCTVLLDGLPVSSCGMLAADVDGAEVRTVESLSAGGELTPLQAAFVERVGSQCGYCTPGQLMTATALLETGEPLTPERVKDWMQTNLCRCGSYVGILEAIEAAAARSSAGGWTRARPGSA
jgi:aerobic-type carbon monoxide dehydrogenase small subunit (CoxS/CutS family)